MASRDHTIETYRGKRDFQRTPEPAPAAHASSKTPARDADKPAIFVVQKHAARRLHWDFRLEHGGVLWSWAVPKGPSMDTADKRLAVHVEDHPVDYASFQGTIPAGNYGAGTVETWDRGIWRPLGDASADLARGELKFELDGARLHGGFVLVRLKPRAGEKAENWLLIKEHDGAERSGLDVPALEATPLAAAGRKLGTRPDIGAKPEPAPRMPAKGSHARSGAAETGSSDKAISAPLAASGKPALGQSVLKGKQSAALSTSAKPLRARPGTTDNNADESMHAAPAPERGGVRQGGAGQGGAGRAGARRARAQNDTGPDKLAELQASTGLDSERSQDTPHHAGRGWSAPEGAVQRALPTAQAPMLASNADVPPDGGEWLSEIKFDGYRLIVRRDSGGVTLLTRNGLDWTRRLPRVARAVAALPGETLMADGELVYLQNDGLSSFPDLQAALKDGRDGDLHLYLFDLLYRDGYDLRALPLVDRKAALSDLVTAQDFIRISDHLDGITDQVRKRACAMGLEGIICKRADAPYRAGRSRDWLKVKCQGREEFLVVGWTPPQGSRTGLGSLQLGFYDETRALHYVGGCGSGFTDAVLHDLSAQLAKLAAEPPARMRLTEEKPPANVHWVRPDLVAEVQYTGWSGAGRLRHAVFLGLREDKTPDEVVRDVPDPDVRRVELSAAVGSHSGRVVHAPKPAVRTAEVAGVRLTHPDRELWPGDGGHKPVTKQDLAAYWRAVAGTALPGIAGRPLAFVRCPDGIAGEHFFQKHANRGMPAALREGAFDDAPYLALDGVDGLVATAQIAAVELHSWGSSTADPGRADRLVFDLDPGEGVAWPAIVAAAHDLKARLEAEGYASWCRTSGGKGLHLVVPLVPSGDWDGTRAWCRAFAEKLERAAPDLYVASVPKARRRGRILIDWLRNGLGSTAIASFSPRARSYATVAVPVTWREVTAKLDPQSFTVHSVPARLAKLRADPWEGFTEARQSLSPAKSGQANTVLAKRPQSAAKPEPATAGAGQHRSGTASEPVHHPTARKRAHG